MLSRLLLQRFEVYAILVVPQVIYLLREFVVAIADGTVARIDSRPVGVVLEAIDKTKIVAVFDCEVELVFDKFTKHFHMYFLSLMVSHHLYYTNYITILPICQ